MMKNKLMTCSLASWLKASTPMPYSLYGRYKKSSKSSTRQCTWPFPSGKSNRLCTQCNLMGFSTSLSLRSGWCASYRACMKMPEAECVLVAVWATSSVWTLEFTKALAWAPFCSPWFSKPSPKSFVHDVPGKTCVQVTWSPYLNCWKYFKRSWYSGSLS